jgi:hypothetical protein
MGKIIPAGQYGLVNGHVFYLSLAEKPRPSGRGCRGRLIY